jgi:hypothetical protein
LEFSHKAYFNGFVGGWSWMWLLGASQGRRPPPSLSLTVQGTFYRPIGIETVKAMVPLIGRNSVHEFTS